MGHITTEVAFGLTIPSLPPGWQALTAVLDGARLRAFPCTSAKTIDMTHEPDSWHAQR